MIKIPKWFYDSGLNEVGPPSMDHVEAIKRYDGIIEVQSRPYHVLAEQLDDITLICKYNKISYKFSGKTTYSNKDTLTLSFWLDKDVKALEDSKFVDEILRKK